MDQRESEAISTGIAPATRFAGGRPPQRLIYLLVACCGIGLALLVYYSLKYLGY